MSMIKLSEILFEENKYKKEIGTRLPNWQDKIKEYEQTKEYFVHFSNVPKVGLYLINKYDTPIGFYSYPLDFSKMSDFGVDRSYAIVFNIKNNANLLNLKQYTTEEYKADIKKLKTKYNISATSLTEWEEEALVKTPGGFIWNITRNLSIEGILQNITEGTLYDTKSKENKKIWNSLKPAKKDSEARKKILNSYKPIPVGQKGGGNTGKWTMILNKVLGYDGVIDDCLKIIHKNEPCQAVFFNTGVINVAEIINITENIRFKTELNGKKSDYSNKNLSGAKFSMYSIPYANFYKSNLKDTDFTYATLTNCNFEKSNMENTKLFSATLTAANLKNTILINADLGLAELFNTNLTNANLTGALLTTTRITNAKFKNVNFTNAIFKNTDVYGASFVYANFSGATFLNTAFWNCNLSGANFENTDITKVKFGGSAYSNETKFPQGFNPDDKNMVNLDDIADKLK